MTGRRAVLAAAVLALAAGCAGKAEPTPGAADETESLADVLWIDQSLAAGDVDTCDAIAVLSDPSQNLRVAVVDENLVYVPEVTPPEESDVVIRRDWLTSGGCVPTAAGPVVVVEARVAYANLYDDDPKIVAGFTPDGDQLWSIELAGDLAGRYDGRGSVIFESLDDNEWLLVDARTGATVASGHGVKDAPVTSLGPTLVDDIDGGLADVETGKEYGRVGDTTPQVDDDRLLLQTIQGVRLVRLPDLKVIWKAQEDVRLTGIWTRAADLSTSTVVAFATDGRIIGLDLRTGREKWSSSVDRSEVNGLDTQVGSGVFVFRRNGHDPLGQVVIDSATGEELTGADGFVLADQGLLLQITSGVATPVTVDDLR